MSVKHVKDFIQVDRSQSSLPLPGHHTGDVTLQPLLLRELILSHPIHGRNGAELGGEDVLIIQDDADESVRIEIVTEGGDKSGGNGVKVAENVSLWRFGVTKFEAEEDRLRECPHPRGGQISSPHLVRRIDRVI